MMKNKTKNELMMMYAKTYNEARLQLYIKKDYKLAEKLFRRLYRIVKAEARVDNSTFNPAVVFLELGNLHLSRNRLGRALWYLKQADDMFGPPDPRWCGREIVWTDQAKVHIARGHYAKANELYIKAIESIQGKSVMDANNKSILSGVIRGYASLLDKQQRFAEAASYKQQAKELAKEVAAEGFG